MSAMVVVVPRVEVNGLKGVRVEREERAAVVRLG